MQCPTCLRELPKEYWMPVQWVCGAVTEHYSQCKICDGILAASKVRPMPSTSSAFKEALELVELLTHFRSGNCAKVVYRWLELPEELRLSCCINGAIKCRHYTDPRHYWCPIKNRCYFDPSEWVYAVTMRLMMPKMMFEEVRWNKQTIGELFEPILGCHYMVDNGFMRLKGPVFENVSTVAAIFDDFVYLTWKLCRRIEAIAATGNCDTAFVMEYTTWITDMVAWRQMKDDHINEIVIYHADRDDEFDLRPRCKRFGRLDRMQPESFYWYAPTTALI